MAKMTQEQKIIKIANKFDTLIRAYSGRGMFGAECVGVEVSAADFTPFKAALKRAQIGGMSIDNMGLDMIVYWPSISKDHPDFFQYLEEQ